MQTDGCDSAGGLAECQSACNTSCSQAFCWHQEHAPPPRHPQPLFSFTVTTRASFGAALRGTLMHNAFISETPRAKSPIESGRNRRSGGKKWSCIVFFTRDAIGEKLFSCSFSCRKLSILSSFFSQHSWRDTFSTVFSPKSKTVFSTGRNQCNCRN